MQSTSDGSPADLSSILIASLSFVLFIADSSSILTACRSFALDDPLHIHTHVSDYVLGRLSLTL